MSGGYILGPPYLLLGALCRGRSSSPTEIDVTIGVSQDLNMAQVAWLSYIPVLIGWTTATASLNTSWNGHDRCQEFL